LGEKELLQWYQSRVKTVRQNHCARTFSKEQTGPLDRRRFKSLITKELQNVLGRTSYTDGPELWGYRNSIGRFSVETVIAIGGKHQRLEYHHRTQIADMLFLDQWGSVGYWLGIGGTIWTNLTDAEAPRGAHLLAICCEQFMGAIPNLLEGLVPALSVEELETCWLALDLLHDRAKPSDGLWTLAGFPEESVSFLRNKLSVARLIENASYQGLSTGEYDRRPIRKLLLSEMRPRLDMLLDNLNRSKPTADEVRATVSVVILQLIGTWDAVRLLKALADSTAFAPLAEEARVSLEMLTG
jgi:hypothetical protein